ncbi:3-phosphoglycerate dehydrogenase [Adlercreutzia agrestimuris]|uniref:3-phosphoglycerate dehydrogenase n=1 Tax=Adlercreutzia agrestimuris TaxID=2941324 RepID=UPI00203AAED8|nr:3-phosphoglycerate dehydrogenase [Adlercreutzia agrestimuris]
MRLIHCLNNISSQGTDLLSDAYGLSEDATTAEGILVRSAAMHDMEFGENLLAIARAGAGVNNIPLERCAQEGIVVFNTPGANANAVKELVLCALLLGSRGIIDGIAWCKDNAADENIAKSAEKAKKAFAGREIAGKRLGVIGLGAIGALVANAAIDLGMDVYGYDPYVSVGAAWRLNPAVHHACELTEIFAECDYITIHVPALPNTIGMINEDAINHMKDGVVFLNFSRDTLVDNNAMATGLSSGKVGAYITDFATPEIMRMEHAIVLPHLGASTEEAEDNCAMMAVRQMMAYLETGSITNSVNFPACQLGPVASGCARIAVLRANDPEVLGRAALVLQDQGCVIENSVDVTRKDTAYSVYDVADTAAADQAAAALSDWDGIYKVRVIR